MGFGLIFLGYIFTVFDMGFMVNEALSVFVCKAVCCVGYGLLIFGLTRYAGYSETAKRAIYAFSVLFLLYTADAVIQGMWHFGAIGEQTMAGILTWIFPLIAAFYALSYVLLFLALRRTAKETDCPRVEKKAVRSISVTVPYCILNLALSLPFAFASYMTAIRYVIFLAVTAINSITLYSAYMWICLDTDIEKEKALMAKWRKKK